MTLPFLQPDFEALEQRLTEQALRTVPLLSPYFIENWTPALRALSVQTEVITLTAAEAAWLDAIIQGLHGGGEAPSDNDPSRFTLLRSLHRAIDAVGGRAFVRLGSRSPKDSIGFLDRDMQLAPVVNAQGAIDLLTSESERMWHDLGDARRAGYLPSICVRRYIEIDPDQEFRCFVEDGKIVGITQYHLKDGAFWWIEKNAAALEVMIRRYLSAVVIPVAGLPDFTADIIIKREMVPFLLEVNPPLSMGKTFPGLFNGNEADADGTFRYLKAGPTA